MKKDFECKHHNGSGYHYDLVGHTIWICKRCERKLRQQIIEQIEMEDEFDMYERNHKLKLENDR